MMNWDARDWTSLIIGWLCGIILALILPHEPWGIVLIFAGGFVTTWIARQVIPR